jgi:hypothetical protein
LEQPVSRVVEVEAPGHHLVGQDVRLMKVHSVITHAFAFRVIIQATIVAASNISAPDPSEARWVRTASAD